jgi:hypothetical protein
MADAPPPPAIEAVSGVPPGLPKKRGPKPDHDTAQRVFAIVARVEPDGDWRSNLDETCEALDEGHVPVPSTWRRNRDCRSWSVCLERDVVVKAIEYRLRLASQRKKRTPETLS